MTTFDSTFIMIRDARRLRMVAPDEDFGADLQGEFPAPDGAWVWVNICTFPRPAPAKVREIRARHLPIEYDIAGMR